MSQPTHQGVAAVLASASLLGAAKLLGFAVRAIYLALLARLLGPELYGLLAYGQSWYNAFVPITALGLGASLSLRIADDRGDASQAIADVLSIRLFAVLIAVLASVSFALAFEPDPAARQLLMLLSWGIVGRTLVNTWQQVFTAFGKTGLVLVSRDEFKPLLSSSAAGACCLTFALPPLATSMGITGVLLASMAANAVWAGLLVARLCRGPAALGTGFLSGPALAAPLLAVLGYELTRGLWLQPLAGMLVAGCLLGWTLFAVADARRQSQPGSVTDGLDDPGDSPPATPGDGARSRSYPSCH